MFKRAKFTVATPAELAELGKDFVEARGWDFAANGRDAWEGSGLHGRY